MFDTQTTTLRCKSGATFNPSITLTSGGAPFSLVGWTAAFVLPDPNITLTVGSGLVVDAAHGIITPTVTASATAALTGSVHFYVKLTDPSGNVGFPLDGQIIFTAP